MRRLVVCCVRGWLRLCAVLVAVYAIGNLPALAEGIRLAWDPVVGVPLAGYIVHCRAGDDVDTVAFPVGDTTLAEVSGLSPYKTYSFQVSAVSTNGVEGELSNELKVSIPDDPREPPASPGSSELRAIGFPSPSNSVMIVRSSGLGSVAPNLHSRQLINGRTYQLSATPAKGYVFGGWSGGANSASSRITFTMKPGMMLDASFIPSPFISTAGVYTGLFYEQDAIRPATAGFFSITTTTRGTYSGRMQIGNSRYSFSGEMDVNCSAVSSIRRGRGAPFRAEWRVRKDDDVMTILGEVLDTNWTARMIGDVAVFNSRTNPAPYGSNYTFGLPGSDGIATIPTGDSFGTVRTTTAGNASFTAMLSDGSRFVQSAPISKAGIFPLFAPLQTGKGLMTGWVTFTSGPEADMVGQLNWIKPSGVSGTMYPGGFTNEFEMLGSSYLKPAGSSNQILNLPMATVSFTGGNLTEDFSNSVAVGAGNRVTNLSTNRMSLSFSTANGTFRGSVTDPHSGESRSFSGVALQRFNAGAGFMAGTNQSSRVLIE